MFARTTDLTRSATHVSPAAAREAIAACVLGEDSAPLRVGDISLHAHQRSALRRVRRTIATYGGSLLCDEVGLGKTYVALALASGCDGVTVVAPAALREMWRHAVSVTGVTAEIVSTESLGRNGAPRGRSRLIIVDEAHHFRNSSTRRYAELARMCMLCPALLLTATPLHNSRDDLSAVVALFLGSRAYAMTDAELAPLVVRRSAMGTSELTAIPVVQDLSPTRLTVDESLLDMILALPAPVPPSDGSVATRLVVYGLVRQWASSNAALIGALKRRIARSHSLLASLDAGRYPTAAELSAWIYTGDAVQLAFAELLSPATTPLAALATSLREHATGLADLLSRARRTDDGALADFVREVRSAHPNEMIVAFSCYAETADALYRSLRRDGHVALLTARGAVIASGPVSRAEILAQFAPHTVSASPVTERESVSLLIATDLLSEGVNLQAASVIIHLDVPWTAARIEQRTGRLARMGSRHERVASYSVIPSPRAESFLRELEIVARKSDLANRLLGRPAATGGSGPSTRSSISCAESTRATVESWYASEPPATTHASGPLVSFASTRTGSTFGAPQPGASAVGAWMVDGVPTLLAWESSTGIALDAAHVEAAVQRADAAIASAPAAPAAPAIAIDATLSSILTAATAWYDQRRAWRAVGGSDDVSAVPRAHDARRSLARVADAAASTSFARRSQSAAVATRLRNAAASPLPLAVEWSLENLADYPDDADVDTILDLVDRARPAGNDVKEEGFRCVALIVMR